MRIATFAAPLSRDGPGLLLRDLGREDAQIDAALAIMAEVKPDIIVLTNVDHDFDGLALAALQRRVAAMIPGIDHAFALTPNTGLPTGYDLDRNGRLGEARDAQGYGRFRGDGGMAILSRWPINSAAVTDLSALIWADQPFATLPEGYFTAEEKKDLRLSTTGHWIVPVAAPGGAIDLLAFSATPPVFDGPEDRNGLRNRDELRLWTAVLDGAFGAIANDFVVIGNSNLDPVDGDGFPDAMRAFLADPRLQDPLPASDGAAQAADTAHQGDPAFDTADWDDTGPGNLRVSYVLPSASLRIADAGVFWPAPDDPKAALMGDDGLAAGPHRLVWVDVSR